MGRQHHCHALGCSKACPAAHLMCRSCWAKVPRAQQAEVYRTVKLRSRAAVNSTWAPWWRAQAVAIAGVAHRTEPNEAQRDAYLKRAMLHADKLEVKGP